MLLKSYAFDVSPIETDSILTCILVFSLNKGLFTALIFVMLKFEQP